jgi:heat shock protein HslJ
MLKRLALLVLMIPGPLAAQPMPADATGDLRAQGNEPFWAATISGADLLLRRPDFPDLVFSVTGRTAGAGDSLVIRAASASPALSATLTLGAGPCADTMADQTYPFTAALALDDVTLSGCAGDPRLLLTTVETWQVERLAGDALVPDTEVTLSFGEDDVVAGSGGCNRYSGLYEITGEGLTVGAIAATRMACPEPAMSQEMTFLDLLGNVVSFDIGEGGGLSLVTRDGARIETRAP